MEIDSESAIPRHLDLLSKPGTREFAQCNRLPINLVEEGSGCISDLSSSLRQGREFGKQYAHTYFIRLSTIRPVIEERIRNTWTDIPLKKIAGLCESSTTSASSPKKTHGHNSPKKYTFSPVQSAQTSLYANQDEEHGQHIALREDITVAIIGTVFKQQPNKPSILQELIEEIQLKDRSTKESYISDKDVVLLEDETTRVRLFPSSSCGITINELVNGMVLGVKGRPTIDGKFEVEGVIYATPGPASWPDRKYSETSEMVFVSGLQIGSESDSINLGMLFEYLQGLSGSTYEQDSVMRKQSRVFFLGNSIHVGGSGSEIFKITAKNSEKLDRMLSVLAQTMEVFVVTGKEDPVEAMYPQPPMHKCLFPLSTQYASFHLLSNPSRVSIPVSGQNSTSSLDLILTDGEPIADAMKCSDATSSLQMGRRMLEWGHLCPTAPDTLPLHPGVEDDVFFIQGKLPHFFLIGNQKEFGHMEWRGSTIIAVPRFSASAAGVIVTKEYKPQLMQFNLSI